jgi:hypothetical protein
VTNFHGLKRFSTKTIRFLKNCTGATGKGEQMEKKFGIFNTVEELNRAAAAQKAEGDLEALIGLATENGLEKEDAEDYMDSDDAEDTLCNETMAAIGKLKLEAEDLKLESQMKDWKDFVVQMLMEYPTQHMEEDGAALANAVFNPDKKLLDVLAAGLKMASKNRVTIDRRITKAAGLPESAGQIGMCGKDELKKIILDYYMGDMK